MNNADTYIIKNTEYDQLRILNDIQPNQYIIKTPEELNKKFIISISDKCIKITDKSINKEPVSISNEYYFACVVEAPNVYIALFEAGVKYRDMQNS